MTRKIFLSDSRPLNSIGLLAGYVNTAVSAAVTLVTVPLLLGRLGVEEYGVVAFYMTCRLVLSVLDLGMTQTIIKETAAKRSTEGKEIVAKQFYQFEKATLIVSLAICIGLTLCAGFLAEYWFHSTENASLQLERNLMLLGAAVALRWPSTLYQGVLIGAERIVLSSVMNIMFVLLAEVGVFALWAFTYSSVELYFAWQSMIGLLFSISSRYAARRELGSAGRTTSWFFVRIPLRGFTGDVAIISAFGIVLSQVDKIVVSKILTLADFAKYSLGTMVAASLYVLIHPVFNVMFPRFTYLFTNNQQIQLEQEYSRYGRLLARMLFPTATFIVLVSNPLLLLWTGDAVIANEAGNVVAVVACSYALHGVMYAPYALVLSSGNTRSILGLYSMLLAVVIPFTVWCTNALGIFGAAISHLLHFTLYFIIGSWYTHRIVLRGYLATWLIANIIPAMLASILSCTVGLIMLHEVSTSMYFRFIVSFFAWAIAFIITIVLERLAGHYRLMGTGF